ncbi:MAG TPA: PaaI family thioesterase, partial [Pyrinomonadaceae bacterium]|nr:PaaI family thioesterase [Pyrinomonadaceae bacterium]
MSHQPTNPAFIEQIQQSFTKQTIMALIGGELTRVEPGIVEITLPYRSDLTQQHGYVHAGIITTIADSACGYAAYTLMPPNSDVLAVEFKVN